MNLLINCARHGISMEDCFVVCTHTPCADCSRFLYQAGIDTVIAETHYHLYDNINIDDLKISCSEKNINKRGFSNRWEYDEKHKDNCIDSNNVILSKRNSDNLQVSSSSECRIYALEQVKHNNNLVTPKTPYISIFILLSCLFITLYETRNFTKK